MEIHIRTLAFVFLSLLGSASLPFVVASVPNGPALNTSLQVLPTPTLVPRRGLSTPSRRLAAQLQQATPNTTAQATLILPATTTTATVRTSGANLNIRSGPGQNHTIISSASPGTVLSVTGISADSQWLQISMPQEGGRGWVYAALTILERDAQTLPVVDQE